jgi:hypothetical protein
MTDILRAGCESKLRVDCNLQDGVLGYNLAFQYKGTDADQKDAWELLNYNDRIYSETSGVDYFHNFFKDWAVRKMRTLRKSQHSFYIDTGLLYFFETMLKDEDGDNYVAEAFQLIWLLTPSSKMCVTSTRRGTKTTTLCQAKPLYNAVMHKGHSSVIITQGWETAMKHLSSVVMWCDNNKKIEEWAGGRKTPWSNTEITFKNRSYIKTFTGSSTDKIRGLIPAPKTIIRDELAFHETDSPEAVIIKLGTKKKEGVNHEDIVTSTPIAGDNTFSRVQVNKTYDHFFHTLYCPKGLKRYHCDESCPHFSWYELEGIRYPLPECKAVIKYKESGYPDFANVFWRVPIERVSEADILEVFEEIGLMRFEQEFQLKPHSMEGNLFPKAYLDKYVFDNDLNVEMSNFRDDIFVGVDYGLTKNSRSVVAIGKRVGGKNDAGDDIDKIRLVNLKVFPVNTPFNTIRDYIGNDLLDNYKVRRIVADANTPSKDQVENELIPFLRDKRNFTDIVAYHTLGQGGKDFSGKAEMVDMVRNKFELGERLRFFKDQELYSEMLSLRGKETQSGNLVIESSSTTDRFMACLYMAWGAFTTPSSGIVFCDYGRKPSIYTDYGVFDE